MNKQKFSNLFILVLLLVLGVIYGAQVFVNQNKPIVNTVMTDADDDHAEKSEENVKEASQHLFLPEKSLYHLKPMVVAMVNLADYVSKKLPEAYLQLNTPPPDLAIS